MCEIIPVFLFSHHIRQTNNKESNSISLQRIFELEQTEYKLLNKISGMEQKLKKRDDEISNLKAKLAKLKRELRTKNCQLNKQQEQTTISVGFFTLFTQVFSHCLFVHSSSNSIVCTLIYKLIANIFLFLT